MAPGAANEIPLGNGELVLVVDDNEQVREVTMKRLETLGYVVAGANTGPEAIEQIKSNEAIALVLSDIVMPGGMSGYEVGHAASKLRPGIRVLLTSGYDGSAPSDAAGTSETFNVLEKPYSRAALANAVAKALAG